MLGELENVKEKRKRHICTAAAGHTYVCELLLKRSKQKICGIVYLCSCSVAKNNRKIY